MRCRSNCLLGGSIQRRFLATTIIVAVNAAVTVAAEASSGVVVSDITTTTCTAGFVECENGWASTGERCEDACQGQCCVDSVTESACTGFTGKICKDGSCSGREACKYSKIQVVVDSCTGLGSCYSNSNRTAQIVSSCNGDGACSHLTYWLSDNPIGQIGSVVNSCNGNGACYYLGNFGQVGNITDSCNGYYSCFYGAYDPDDSIGTFTRSCNNKLACQHVGFYGNVGAIVDSCNEPNSCEYAGKGYGPFGEPPIRRGYIGNITTSCNANGACAKAGSNVPGNITSNLNYCCNEVNECESKNETSLPAQCRSTDTAPPMVSTSSITLSL